MQKLNAQQTQPKIATSRKQKYELISLLGQLNLFQWGTGGSYSADASLIKYMWEFTDKLWPHELQFASLHASSWLQEKWKYLPSSTLVAHYCELSEAGL